MVDLSQVWSRKLVDVYGVRRRRQRDGLVPFVEHDLAAAASILGELHRIGAAGRRHVDRPAL